MELFTGKILFPTSNTYEHLLMMEKVTRTHFPYAMVEQIKNKEVKPLFDLTRDGGIRDGVRESTISYISQSPDLVETVEMNNIVWMDNIEVARDD